MNQRADAARRPATAEGAWSGSPILRWRSEAVQGCFPARTPDGRLRSALHDIFISYNSRDASAVDTLAGQLRRRGLSVFLDRASLVVGQPWPEALEAAIDCCRAVVVCHGPHGLGPWQMREIVPALNRQHRQAGFPVIPVLLPGSSGALGLLVSNTAVDLRASLENERNIERLRRGALGEPPGDGPEADAACVAICPYRRLETFREVDHPFFQGRADDTARLLGFVLRSPVVAVVGASGCGKSSLVRAGLVPALRQRDAGGPWEIVICEPHEEPMMALAEAFAPLLFEAETDRARLLKAQRALGDGLARGDFPLRDVVRDLLRLQPGTRRLLLVVDGWERLTGDSAPAFVSALLDALSSKQLTLVLTLRADAAAMLAQRPLADRLADTICMVGAMTREGLLQAITEPARLAGLQFQGDLATRILDEVSGEPGQLPLLEFVLSELWHLRRHGNLLTIDDYDSSGGVRQALSKSAERVLAELGPQREADVVRVMKRLVACSDDGPSTRRRIALGELADLPGSADIVGRLTAERLLVTGRDEVRGEQTVEIAHESLIRHWQRLRDWIDADRAFLHWQQRVRGDLRAWLDGRRSDYLLRGERLVEAMRWRAEREIDLSASEREFIEAACQQRDDEVERAARLDRALGDASDRALGAQARERALDVLSRIRAAAERDPTLAAVALADLLGAGPVPDSGVALMLALAERPLCSMRVPGAGRNRGVVLQPSAGRLALASDAAVTVWAFDGRQLARFETSPYCHAIDLSPDGRRCAFVTDGAVVVGSVEDGSVQVVLELATSFEAALKFSDDSATLAVLCPSVQALVAADGSKRLPLAAPALAAAPRWHVKAPAFSSDGCWFAAVVDDRQPVLWSAADGRVAAQWGEERADDLVFSRDGRWLMTVDERYEGLIQGWSTDGRLGYVVAAPGAAGESVALSPDGATLATVGWSDGVGWWPLPSTAWQRRRSRWRAKGFPSWLLPGSDPVATTTLQAPRSEIRLVRFASTARFIATGGDTGAIDVRDRNAKRLVRLEGLATRVVDACFAAGDEAMLGCDDGGEVRAWPLPWRALTVPLGGLADFGVLDAAMLDSTRIVVVSSGALAVVGFDGNRLVDPVTWLKRPERGFSASILDVGRDAAAVIVAIDQAPYAWRPADATLMRLGEGSGFCLRAEILPGTDRVLVSGMGDQWQIFGLDGRELAHGDGQGARYSPAGNCIVSWTSEIMETPVSVCELDGSLRLRHVLRSIGSLNAERLALHPSQALLAAVSYRGLVIVRLDEQRVDPAEFDSRPISRLSFDCAGTQLLACDSGTVHLLDAEGRHQRSFRVAQAGYIEQANFAPDGRSILIRENNGRTTLWGLDGELRFEFTGGGLSSRQRRMTFSGDGQWLINSSSEEGEAALWPLSAEAFRRRVAIQTDLRLTADERRRLLRDGDPG